jgi:hypothetical protein
MGTCFKPSTAVPTLCSNENQNYRHRLTYTLRVYSEKQRTYGRIQTLQVPFSPHFASSSTPYCHPLRALSHLPTLSTHPLVTPTLSLQVQLSPLSQML